MFVGVLASAHTCGSYRSTPGVFSYCSPSSYYLFAVCTYATVYMRTSEENVSELDPAFHMVEMGTVLFLLLCCILPGILGNSVSTSYLTAVVLGAEIYATVPHFLCGF